MIFGSVCSGIEAASAAWLPLGWRCAFMSEIEAFPRAVLAHHYPEAHLHGDFRSIKAGQFEPLDVLIGGTPCQSFSVAGLRGGMADDRGNLALEFLRLVDRLRPRWVVWENVPGVLSSNGGEDFGAFLGGLGEVGYGFAYRILDAQFFGLAQRRERVFVVGCLGDWRRAAAILFERASLSGNPAPRRQAGSRFAGSAGQGSEVIPILDGGKGRGEQPGARDGSAIGEAGGPMFTLRGESRHAMAVDLTNGLGSDLAGTLDTAQAKGNRGHGVVAFSVTPSQSNKHFSARMTDKAQALTTLGNKMSARGGDLVLEPVAFALRGREDGAQAETHDAVSALRSASGGSSRDYVAFAQNTRDEVRLQGGDGQVTGALDSNEGMKQRTYVADGDYAIRRLTPTECERLMGFPDGYTAISFRGKPAADAPRYKALGNSMAVPVIAWLGRRIEAVDKL